MREAILEVIGAVVVTTVILGIPVLSFASFVHDWHVFLKLWLIIGLLVDFLFVYSKLIGETK
jgi:preprotein translocase subunit SecF